MRRKAEGPLLWGEGEFVQRFLLDTNVLSDVISRVPEPVDLLRWLDDNAHLCFVSAISVHELEFGAARLALKKSVEDRLQAANYLRWNTHLLTMFSGRILLVKQHTLLRAAALRARAGQLGGDIGLADAIIAATADILGLYVVTRNARHFHPTGVPVIDTDHFAESLRSALLIPKTQSRFSAIRNEVRHPYQLKQEANRKAHGPAPDSENDLSLDR